MNLLEGFGYPEPKPIVSSDLSRFIPKIRTCREHFRIDHNTVGHVDVPMTGVVRTAVNNRSVSRCRLLPAIPAIPETVAVTGVDKDIVIWSSVPESPDGL